MKNTVLTDAIKVWYELPLNKRELVLWNLSQQAREMLRSEEDAKDQGFLDLCASLKETREALESGFSILAAFCQPNPPTRRLSKKKKGS